MGVGNEALHLEQTYFPLELFVDDPDDGLEQDLELMEDELLMLDDPDLEAFGSFSTLMTSSIVLFGGLTIGEKAKYF